MSYASKKDRLSVEYSELLDQLQGINPKLSTYQKVLKRIKELEVEFGGTTKTVSKIPKTRTDSRRYINKNF